MLSMSTEKPTETDTPDPRYPIGRFVKPDVITFDDRESAILTIGEAPEMLRNAVDGLSSGQIDTHYRDGGWTVRQVIHHVADSHMNAFSRLRLALTEDWPTIYAYKEAAWAELPDKVAPVDWSLDLIESLHARWVMLLQSLTDEQWQLGFRDPERGPMGLEHAALLYGWHCRHHTAHITHLRAAKGW